MKSVLKQLLILSAALPLLASADVVPTNFHGRVFDGGGTHKLADAIITMSDAHGPVASVQTNQNGEFTFGAIPAGVYNFRVTAHGYAIYEREVTIVRDGGMRQLTIRLMVPADKQTVSVGELRRPATTPASRGGF
jgi:hypothetical protein